MKESPHHWILIGAILALVSLPMEYRKAGMEQGSLWVPGGPGFSQSTGSRYVSGQTWTRARKGTETNYHGFLFFPLAGALSWAWGRNPEAPGRRRLVSWLAVICIAIGLFFTNGGNYTGNGFILGLVGFGASIYGLRLSKVRPSPTPAAVP